MGTARSVAVVEAAALAGNLLPSPKVNGLLISPPKIGATGFSAPRAGRSNENLVGSLPFGKDEEESRMPKIVEAVLLARGGC